MSGWGITFDVVTALKNSFNVMYTRGTWKITFWAALDINGNSLIVVDNFLVFYPEFHKVDFV